MLSVDEVLVVNDESPKPESQERNGFLRRRGTTAIKSPYYVTAIESLRRRAASLESDNAASVGAINGLIEGYRVEQ